MKTHGNREHFAHKMKIQEKIHRRQTKTFHYFHQYSKYNSSHFNSSTASLYGVSDEFKF